MEGYLIDTCVVSELSRPSPSEKVRAFLNELPIERTYLSCLTLGEVHKGIERLPESARKRSLRNWFDRELSPRFVERVLVVDDAVALRWGELQADLEAKGRTLQSIDALIAATALLHRLAVVTRNVSDFDGTGVEIINPWE